MLAGIRGRLVFSHLGVIILAMGLSGILLLSFLESYFLLAAEESLIAQARLTAQALIPGSMTSAPPIEAQTPLTNALQQQQVSNLALQTENMELPANNLVVESIDLNYLTDASLSLGAQLETRIRVLDADGFVLVDSWALDSGKDFGSDELVLIAKENEYASSHDQISEDASIHLVLPIQVDGQLVSLIYLSHPLRDIVVVLRDLRTRLLLATVIALSFSGIVGLLFSGAITRPLQGLTLAASAVSQGQFDQQVPVNSRDELGQLGRAFNDMTARLRAARQMQVDFVANVSHELRTPLTSIKGMVETLRAGAVDDIEVRDRFLGTIETETDRLGRLVNDLLLLSQVDSYALNLRLTEVDLGKLSSTIVTRLTTRAEAQDVFLKTFVNSETPLAWVDSDRIEQVLINLLDNALNYSQSGDTVTVRVGVENDKFARVQIHDEGAGIPAKDLPHIGGRFYRTDGARSRSQGGSGLGLAIVRALVEAHGGRFWLESKEGVGTVVSFTLPVS